MTEASSMSRQQNWLDTPNAISSQESASGATRSDSPAGPTPSQSGPGHARASLSARQAKEAGLLTSGTCGLTGTISSSSASLQSSLESRLRARTQILGSTLYKMTWKPWVTPSGRSRSRLRASVRRTSETAHIGWPTQKAADGRGNCYEPQGDCRRTELRKTAGLAGWPTPNTPSGGPNFKSTPTHTGGMDLDGAVTLASWISPQAADANGSGINQHTASLCKQARSMAPGEPQTISLAATAAIGQLNPAHSRWLMGLPPVWDDCGVTAMQSLQKPRRSSSVRSQRSALSRGEKRGE